MEAHQLTNDAFDAMDKGDPADPRIQHLGGMIDQMIGTGQRSRDEDKRLLRQVIRDYPGHAADLERSLNTVQSADMQTRLLAPPAGSGDSLTSDPVQGGRTTLAGISPLLDRYTYAQRDAAIREIRANSAMPQGEAQNLIRAIIARTPWEHPHKVDFYTIWWALWTVVWGFIFDTVAWSHHQPGYGFIFLLGAIGFAFYTRYLYRGGRLRWFLIIF